ncbi:hypothetical protein Hdeb2414_s0009g00315091 [Helianthus debilis subsp. tardiflorus]
MNNDLIKMSEQEIIGLKYLEYPIMIGEGTYWIALDLQSCLHRTKMRKGRGG